MLNRVPLNGKKRKHTHVFIDEFHVVFANEFPAQFVNSARRQFRKRNAKSEISPIDSWHIFGPPAQTMRWCCSVHKTAPQIIKLRDYTNNPHFRGMAFTGIRGDESASRSEYDDVKTTFRMYNAPRAEVELLCDNSVMDAIIDRFGPDVQTYAGDLQNFRVIEEIAVGKVFFNWIFGFEGKVRIKGPESVKKQYREMVMSAMNLV